MLAIWAAVLVLARKLGPEYEPEPELEVEVARRSKLGSWYLRRAITLAFGF